jgi:hypothetical protein
MDKPHLDELMHFTIHEHEFNQLPEDIQKAFKEHEDCDLSFLLGDDRAERAKDLIKKYVKVIKKHKGKETNEECITLDFFMYVLAHMNAQEIRKLNLEKLLK